MMARALTVERLDRDPGPEWDAFVARSRQATPFATRPWIEAAAESAGVAVDHWVVRKGDEWLAVFPAPHRRIAGRAVYVGLPFSAYSTPLHRPDAGGHPMAATSDLHASTGELIATLAGHYQRLDLFLSPSLDDVRPYTWAGWSAVPRYTYVLPTDGSARPSDSVRRHLRKCAEAGLRVTSEWDWPAFVTSFEDTRARQGFPLPIPISAVERLAGRLYERGIAWMMHARTAAGEPIASHIVLGAPGVSRAAMWLAGGLRTHLASGVGSWLMLEVASELGRRGHAEWDLCGADLEGVARFKGELGARLEHYFEVRAPLGLWARGYGLVKRLVRPRS